MSTTSDITRILARGVGTTGGFLLGSAVGAPIQGAAMGYQAGTFLDPLLSEKEKKRTTKGISGQAVNPSLMYAQNSIADKMVNRTTWFDPDKKSDDIFNIVDQGVQTASMFAGGIDAKLAKQATTAPKGLAELAGGTRSMDIGESILGRTTVNTGPGAGLGGLEEVVPEAKKGFNLFNRGQSRSERISNRFEKMVDFDIANLETTNIPPNVNNRSNVVKSNPLGEIANVKSKLLEGPVLGQQESLPETSVPKTGNMNFALPETSVPKTGNMNFALPETSVPKTGNMNFALPETSVPENINRPFLLPGRITNPSIRFDDSQNPKDIIGKSSASMAKSMVLSHMKKQNQSPMSTVNSIKKMIPETSISENKGIINQERKTIKKDAPEFPQDILDAFTEWENNPKRSDQFIGTDVNTGATYIRNKGEKDFDVHNVYTGSVVGEKSLTPSGWGTVKLDEPLSNDASFPTGFKEFERSVNTIFGFHDMYLPEKEKRYKDMEKGIVCGSHGCINLAEPDAMGKIKEGANTYVTKYNAQKAKKYREFVNKPLFSTNKKVPNFILPDYVRRYVII